MEPSLSQLEVRYSHVHIYCDSLRPLLQHKKLEEKLNDFAEKLSLEEAGDVERGHEAWLQLASKHPQVQAGCADAEQYSPAGQDLVEQLLVGLGWRVTGSYDGTETQSLVVTSQDPEGVKFVLTAFTGGSLEDVESGEGPSKKQRLDSKEEPFQHFAGDNLRRFARYHNGRQGIAVLGFEVSRGGVELLRQNYEKLHPKLLVPGSPRTYRSAKVLEVYAYYQNTSEKDADAGTCLRFVEVEDPESLWVLPGVQRADAKFDAVSQAAYCDHWVSNVFDREGFLKTLQDTLGFTPKVDFNAGVVAAGEAQIESTVTGNSPTLVMKDKLSALKDQSQVYLPINNALSEVGHVHVFLRELGQGIQHIASRVEDLAALIQRANDTRKMTGAGLSFLKIPRSYYGYLSAKKLAQELEIGLEDANEAIAALHKAGIVDLKNIVSLDACPDKVAAALPKDLASNATVQHVLRARYRNLYALLRDHVSEETYLRIVRNNILVDIQGEDLLMQIFTSKVLQRKDGEESPFLEFIQRVCSECKDPTTGCPRAIKPGCGGFGIRNFLTLFLSIEVDKASSARLEAEKRGDGKAADIEGRRVEAFTQQLDESNPVLTAISDAMTGEAAALEKGDAAEAAKWAAAKAAGQEALQGISKKYSAVMRALREEERGEVTQ